MPDLVRPTTAVHRSWLGAASEPGYAPRWADDLDLGGLRSPEAFAAYIRVQLADADIDAPRPRGWVAATHLWYVDDDEYLGRLSIRHTLTPWLRDYGGHIGYDVRPSARQQGHATAMLRLSLPWCLAVGIDPALVTCDTDNVASRKVIERAGGVFESHLDGKLRFWVPTAPS